MYDYPTQVGREIAALYALTRMLVSRKVRTPQSRMPGNTRGGETCRKGHRDIPPIQTFGSEGKDEKVV
jgi:hypothetical protein